jgi:hypothetical protein
MVAGKRLQERRLQDESCRSDGGVAEEKVAAVVA